jgi:hypothetical protein
MKRLPFAIVIALSMSWGTPSLAEDVTITTFYPSPFGDYDELTTKGKTTLAADSTANVGIGTTAPDAKLDIEVPNTGTQSLIFLSTPGERGGIAKLTYSTASPFPLILDLDTNSFNIPRPFGIVGGNVGIGTTDPASILHVKNTSGNAIVKVQSTAGQATLELNASNSNPTQVLLSNNSSTKWNIFNLPGAGLHSLNISDATNAKVTILQGGDVGIGTTTPTQKLDVRGRLYVDATGITNGQNAAFITTGSVTGDAEAINANGNVTGKLNFLAANNNRATGSVVFTARVTAGSTGDAYSLYNINGGQAWTIGLDNSDADKFKIAGSGLLGTTDRLTIDTSGNVGIGITAPNSTLDIKGSMGLKVRTITGDTTLSANDNDNVILVNNTNAIDINLHDSSLTPNRVYYIKKISAGTGLLPLFGPPQYTNSVTIRAASGDSFLGVPSLKFTREGTAIQIMSTRSQWVTLNKLDQDIFARPLGAPSAQGACPSNSCDATAACPAGTKIVYADSSAWVVKNSLLPASAPQMQLCWNGFIDFSCMDRQCRATNTPPEPRRDCLGLTSCSERRGPSWPQCVRVWCQ